MQRAQRLGIPYFDHDTPGKSLSEIEDDEGPLDGVASMRPEDREWEEALEVMAAMANTAGASQAPETSGHKRKRSQDEDSGLQSAVKRLKTVTDAKTSDAVPELGRKRKRDHGEYHNLPSHDIRIFPTKTSARSSEALNDP